MPDRRETLQWLLRALALTAAPAMRVAPLRAAMPVAGTSAGLAAPQAAPETIASHGYGRDPDLLHPAIPWPLVLTPEQKAAVTLLADVLLPRDGDSPPASALGVPEFLNEWISAPYPQQRADQDVVLAGLATLQSQAHEPLENVTPARGKALVAKLCAQAAAGEEPHARFFARFRNICLIGYYTTMTGVAEIGYVGYQPSATFSGPPPEVLSRLGV